MRRAADERRTFAGTQPVPYRLPELLAADPDSDVYIPEGEKDTERMRSLGFVATTNSGGAEKWTPDLNKYFEGRRVVVLPDKDQTGSSHGDRVAAHLHGVAKSVRVLVLPGLTGAEDSKDVSNWLDMGNLAENIPILVDEVPLWEPSAAPKPTPQDKWPVLDSAARHGLVGEVVAVIEPHSEADPVAILIQVLTYFGNLLGRSPYYQVEADQHHTNLFGVLVGQTSKGRKGTSGSRARSVMREADPQWIDDCLKGGLSTGEGLINEIRDPVEKWNAKEQEFEIIDPGISDKRLMVVEPEFSATLAVMERPGNTLSPVLRKAWDGGVLSTLTKHSPLKATGGHISVIGHITLDELRARLTRTDAASGFANRFLFVCVRRSKLLPFGGNLPDDKIQKLAHSIKNAADFARRIERVTMTDAAREAWRAVYEELSAEHPGLLGAITARAEAQTVRLALIYALLDQKSQINVLHLKAAIAVWEYCEASAALIFGDALGDPVADEIMRALRQAGNAGMTRTAIRDLFGRHKSGDRINVALGLLLAKGRARSERRDTEGRPSEIWFAIGG